MSSGADFEGIDSNRFEADSMAVCPTPSLDCMARFAEWIRFYLKE
jgi:hypothetical protein